MRNYSDYPDLMWQYSLLRFGDYSIMEGIKAILVLGKYMKVKVIKWQKAFHSFLRIYILSSVQFWPAKRMFSEDNLKQKNNQDLRKICKELNCAQYGDKTTLIKRILATCDDQVEVANNVGQEGED